MFEKRHRLKLTEFEYNLLINGMFVFRNGVLADGIPTDDINELILNIMDQWER